MDRLLGLWVCCLFIMLCCGCETQAPQIVDVRVTNQWADVGHAEIHPLIHARGSEGPLEGKLYISTQKDFDKQDCSSWQQVDIRHRGHRSNEASAIIAQTTSEDGMGGDGMEVDENTEETIREDTNTFDAFPTDLCFWKTLKHTQLMEQNLWRIQGTLSIQNTLVLQPLFYKVVITDQQGSQASWPLRSSDPLYFDSWNTPLVIEQIQPRTASATGQATLWIKGSGWSTQAPLRVYVGEQLASQVKVESAHLLMATLPIANVDMYNQSVPIRIEQNGRVALSEQKLVWVAPPVIEALIPSQGSFDRTHTVVIQGQFAQNVDQLDPSQIQVKLADEVITALILDAQHIQIDVPPGEIGEVNIEVIQADEQTAERAFIRTAPPTLSSISPTTGPDQQSQWVLLTGDNLQRPGQVWFGARSALITEVNDEGTLARALTPISAAQRVDVRYVNPDGQAAVLPLAYRFIGIPSIDGVEPDILSRCGGGITTLVGRNFSLDMQVYVQEQLAEVLMVNAEGTEAQIRVNSGGAGVADVRIIAPDGRSNQYPALLTYGVQPVINTITPNQVPIWGGTVVQVEGSDLARGSRFFVNGTPVEAVNVLNEGCQALVEVRIPASEQEGWQNLEVIHPDNLSYTLEQAVFYVMPALVPAQGLKAGYTNVVLTGLDLRAGLTVRFNGIEARDLTQINTEQWLLTTPASDLGAVEISIFNTDGRGVSTDTLYTAYHFVDEGSASLGATGDCNDVTVADLNQDGIADWVMAMGSSSPVGLLEQADYIFLGDGTSGFQSRSTLPPPYGNGMNVEVADLNQDNRPDILMINLFSERNFVWQNQGSNQWRESMNFPITGPHYDGGIFDADGDGDPDVFLMRTGDEIDNELYGPEQLFINTNGTWTEQSEQIDFNLADVHDHDMNYADLNGDGLIDVVIVVDNLPGSFPGASNRILINRGNGRFDRINSDINRYPGDWLDVVLADMNGDTYIDIVLPQDYIEGISIANTPPIVMFWGNGDGTFTDASEQIINMPPLPAFGAQAHDIDQDGDMDLMVAVYGISYADGSIEPFESVLLLNDGTGQLIEANASFDTMSLTPSAHFVLIDLDTDGDLDMIECAAESQSRIWRQREDL